MATDVSLARRYPHGKAGDPSQQPFPGGKSVATWRRWFAKVSDLPLRYKIIVPVVFVEVCVFLVAMCVNLSSVRKVAEQGMHAEARAHLRLLGAAYLQMALTGEQEYYRDLVRVVSRAPDVVLVEMRPVSGAVPSDSVTALGGGAHRYTTWQRVQLFRSATDIGISYTDRAVQETLAQAQRRYLWFIILGVLLTSAVLWACVLAITDPVTRVAEAAERIAEGGPPPSFFISRKDEVGTLTHAFETMAKKLRIAQRQLEEIIVERTRQLEAMFHNTPVGVLQIGPDRKVVAVNPMMADMIGCPAEEIVGETCFAVFGAPGPCEECVLSRNDKPISRHMCTLRPGTRDERFLETTVVRVHTSNGDGPTVMELAHDVTEERRLQAQLLQSSKLASIGQLASGIAHEINNPLATIRLRCDSIMADIRELNLPESLKEDVAAIQRQAARVNLITQELLTFSRCSTAERSAVDLGEVITSACVLVEHHARKKALTLKREDAPHLPRISANKTHLEQVVVNLLNNAIDASSPNGTVVIRTRVHDDGVEIWVRDWGKGIPEADLERIFDPFYTTKDVGEGTGLGLSISYGIVSAHGGRINVESRPEEGTTVTVRLPVNAGDLERVAEP